MLRTLDQFIKYHGNGAQNDDRRNDHVQLEDLRSVNNQIAEASSGSQKFADDDAYQRQADVYFHAA